MLSQFIGQIGIKFLRFPFSLASELDANLADELLALIMDHDSDFFERVVVQLLEKMGYGQGVVTKRSADGGIDGLITTDELGFRPICTQAKRFSSDNKVSRPMVQAFVGALNGAPNDVATNHVTIRRYMSYLRDAFVFYEAQRYDIRERNI